MRWKMTAGLCFIWLLLNSQNVLLMPVDVIVAEEETTLWGVLEGEREYDVFLSQAWEMLDEDVAVLERGAAQTYVWEYDLEDGVALCSDFAHGLVKPVADSWHLFDCQRFELLDGKDEGTVDVRLRYWDIHGVEHCASRQMTVVRKAEWESREAIDLRRQLGVVRGLHYLQCHQNVDGAWQEGEGDWYWVATTACAVWAFGNHGYGVGKRKDNPFLSCVKLGIQYLMKSCNVCQLINGSQVDGNGNGRAVRFGTSWKYSNYVHPICVCGLIAGGTPEYGVAFHNQNVMEPELTEMCQLQDVVEDGVDFILMQLSANGRYSWAYDFSDGGDGYDLSIAGWNYMALLAAQLWGVEISRDVRLKFRTFLESVYYRDGSCFIYTPTTPGNHTESLDASGVIGLLLMSGNGLLDDELQCFDERHGIGEAVVDGTRQLFEWVRTVPGRNVGYSWWSVAKGLGLAGVTDIEYNDVKFDWRYGCLEEGRQMTGGWRKILEGQEPDGKWTIDEDMYYYGLTRVDWRQTCMETAMMVLALSDNVLPRKKGGGQTVNVVLQIPKIVSNGLVDSHLGDMQEEKSDGSVLLEWSRSGMKGGEEWDLSFDYWLGASKDKGREVVQIGGNVFWEKHDGQIESISLEELVIERTGNGYGMIVQSSESCGWGDEVLIDVELSLPKGDMSRVVQFSEGTDEAVLWESANVVTWLGAEFYGDLNQKQLSFFLLPDSRMRNWVPCVLKPTISEEVMFEEDTCGQSLKAVVNDASNGGTIVVYGNEETIYAEVVLEHLETGKVYEVEQWEILPAAFGGIATVRVAFDSGNVLWGRYRCHGKIWKEGTILATGDCSVEITMQDSSPGWLQETTTQIVAELEFERPEKQEGTDNHEKPPVPLEPSNPQEPSNSQEPSDMQEPIEPIEPINPIDPIEPGMPETVERHGAFFMKRATEEAIDGKEQSTTGGNVNSHAEGMNRQEKETRQNMADVIYKREVVEPGAWANLEALKGLGLRWGRIVTKNGPYPWEIIDKKHNEGKDNPLQAQSKPVFCEHCEKYWRLYGLIMKPEKDCCIYGMLMDGGWLLK